MAASSSPPIHCVTCCQALPKGMKHPEFFAQSKVEPDPTAVYDLHDELEFIVKHIRTISEALLEIHGDRADQVLCGLYLLLSHLSEEAERRAIRLRNAGLYWQGEIDQRTDGNLFPDLPPPPAVQHHGKED